MKFTLKIWRQKNARERGHFVEYPMETVTEDMSFLEMLDVLNEDLIKKGEEPIAFDHDCREGICGSCGVVINGRPHGPLPSTTTCQLHMRHFRDGETIVIEPWRAKAFPVVKDLVVDRSSLDRILQVGGYISVGTGSAPEANSIPVPKPISDNAFEAATCIGCGACVAACKNASAALFLGAKISHLNSLPQGKAEQHQRTLAMVAQHEKEGFGHCSNTGACEAECPKSISLRHIAKLNRDFLLASLFSNSL